MNALELSEKLRRRRAELEQAQDWVAFQAKGAVQSPYVSIRPSELALSKACRVHLGWHPGCRVSIEYSPSVKALRISKTADKNGYALKDSGVIPARAIYREYGLRVPPNRPRQEVILFPGAIVIDVADLVPASAQ